MEFEAAVSFEYVLSYWKWFSEYVEPVQEKVIHLYMYTGTCI
jgi:hypothetical protein